MKIGDIININGHKAVVNSIYDTGQIKSATIGGMAVGFKNGQMINSLQSCIGEIELSAAKTTIKFIKEPTNLISKNKAVLMKSLQENCYNCQHLKCDTHLSFYRRCSIEKDKKWPIVGYIEHGILQPDKDFNPPDLCPYQLGLIMDIGNNK
jgi:hypothetical protein